MTSNLIARQLPDSVQPRAWYRVENKASDSSADVYIYDEIGGWFGVTASDFVRDLAALDVDRINLWVNSPGGSIFDGIAMLNAIRRHPANVVATVDGLAASAASFLVMGADEIVMGRNSQMMIHDGSGLCWGPAADMQDMADLLSKLSDTIAEIYAERAGGKAADWREAMLAETWYTAEEAVTAGLADRVDKAKQAEATNTFDLGQFQHAGRDHAPAPTIPTNSSRDRHDWSRADRLIASAHQALQAKHQPPAEPVATTNPITEGDSDMSDKLIEGLRNRLGIKADAELDETGLLAALDETLAEQASDNQPTAHTNPPGTVIIDAAQLEQLKADAKDGREARAKQLADERTSLVNEAVQDGRIPPSRKDAWLNMLEQDPGAAEALQTLEPVLNLAAKGFTGGPQEAGDTDDNLYAAAWPQAGSTSKEG